MNTLVEALDRVQIAVVSLPMEQAFLLGLSLIALLAGLVGIVVACIGLAACRAAEREIAEIKATPPALPDMGVVLQVADPVSRSRLREAQSRLMELVAAGKQDSPRAEAYRNRIKRELGATAE
ncbi:MAG: hypothetical protein VW405_00750 [Rhodospirillaceae bacterium]